MNQYTSRLSKIEKAINGVLTDKKIVPIIVDKSLGETEDVKITDKETELGRKLNKNSIILVCISDYGQ